MIGRKRRRRGSGIVALIVCLVVGFTALATARERYDFGFPEFTLAGVEQSIVRALNNLADLSAGQPATASPQAPVTAPAPPLAQGSISVHFIDVGQGDAALIIAPEKTVLIDGGDNGWGPTVLSYLSAHGVYFIDILIATHPHADHIGGLIEVVRTLPIGEVIMPEVPEEITPTTRTYENFLMALLERDLAITPATPGDAFDLGGGAIMTILGPLRDYNEINNMSVVARLEFGDTSFLFTGDIEMAAEIDLSELGEAIASDVLGIAHHGSRTSTAQRFLDAVSPSIAVISCGLDNRFGHPHRAVLERLEDAGVRVFRTDINGSITLISDGRIINIITDS